MSAAGYHGERSPDRVDALVWGLSDLSQATAASLPWLFVSERGASPTSSGRRESAPSLATCGRTCCATPAAILANLSQVPDLRLIQDYLGHKNIKNTARYTRTSARRFEGLWD
jgi:integrase